MSQPTADLPSSPDSPLGGATPARRLLDWYDAHRRELPWRRDRDPYRVWVSEVMLQQTRVETVLPYYARFLERFPDVVALAEAPLDDLLALWSGLGYYRRARQMHAAARAVVEEHGGRFPATEAGLRSLPGIGPYTAAAIGSICFGVVTPVMDGNVERLVGRLIALDADPKATAPRRRLLAAAADLLDPDRPGDGNQAMMELGATVCTPRSPRCLLCPLRRPGPAPAGGWRHGAPTTSAGAGDEAAGAEASGSAARQAAAARYPGCRAFHEGEPESFPPPRRRRKPVRERRLLALVERPGDDGEPHLLLFRRPDDAALLAGTWELPWVVVPEGADGADGASGPAASAPASSGPASFDPAAALAARYGAAWSVGERLAEVRHGITHRAITVAVHRAGVDAGGGLAEAPGGLEPGWFPRPALADLPLSSMVTKSLAAVG